MDFARKQLEKYGWTDGKGLGKNESGISEALKPKLKRSVTGVGYDPAKDFTEHWWSKLYNKAASNVQVEDEEGKTKKIKRKDDSFEITNSTFRLKNKTYANADEEYVDFFVKTEVLDNDGLKIVKAQDSETSDESDGGVKMTDEQLFAACGGRTAHKGARHGLRALGKLARIEQQEQLLLQESRFNGYSQFKKNKKGTSESQVVEDTLLNSDQERNTLKQKKKKKKRCASLNLDSEKNYNNDNDKKVLNDISDDISDVKEEEIDKKSKKRKKDKIKDAFKNESDIKNESVDNNEIDSHHIKKHKKKKKNNECVEEMDKELSIDVCTVKQKVKRVDKCKKKEDRVDNIQNEISKKKQKKCSTNIMPDDLKVTLEIDQIPEKYVKKLKIN